MGGIIATSRVPGLKKPAKILVNGWGQIGRIFTRVSKGNTGLNIVGINDLASVSQLGPLFIHDSIYGGYKGKAKVRESAMIIDGKEIPFFSEKDPANIPYKDLGVDYVIDCTGAFLEPSKAQQHLDAGARKVILSAPAKGTSENLQTIVIGVNDHEIDPGKTIFSNASCTTNCLSPLVRVLNDAFGVEKGLMTTVHAYTNDQNIQDGPHKDPRRARAATLNMIPTTTGAAKALKLVTSIEKSDGISIRVPIPTVSMVDWVGLLKEEVTKDEVNNVFRAATSNESLKGILAFSEGGLVSSDVIGNSHSSIIDGPFTMLASEKDKMLKVLSWYDNIFAFSVRLGELVILIAAEEQGLS